MHQVSVPHSSVVGEPHSRAGATPSSLSPGLLEATVQDWGRAREAVARFGGTRRQEPIEWAGDEPLPLDLAALYRGVGPEDTVIDTFGLPFQLFSLERLWDEQADYRWSRRTGARLVDWNEDWTVIARQGPDPLIHEAGTGLVLTAPADQGWEDRLDEPEPTFTSVLEMLEALVAIGTAWTSVEDPFTDQLCLTGQVRSAVLEGLTRVLGTRDRAAALAHKFGYEPAPAA